MDAWVDAVGYVDSIHGNRVAGWARCGDAGCGVDLLIDEVVVSTEPANRFRADLVGVASADGKRAFIISVPPRYCDGITRVIEIRLTETKTTLALGRFEFSHVFSYQSPLLVVKPDPSVGGRAKMILSLLRPVDVIGGRLVRLGGANDGGYVMLDRGLEKVVVYSLGIADDVAWDFEMAAAGCDLYQYDHTIDGLPKEHPNFHWSKTGIAGRSSADGIFRSIVDLIGENGHAGRSDLILKMDIEGFEWEVLETLPRETLMQFSQIIAEFHALTTLDLDDDFLRIAGVLQKLKNTHHLIHIHANNCGYLGLMGGVPLPDTIEVTYVRTQDHDFQECRRVFPTSLDMPCSPDAADIYLGPMGQNADI